MKVGKQNEHASVRKKLGADYHGIVMVGKDFMLFFLTLISAVYCALS